MLSHFFQQVFDLRESEMDFLNQHFPNLQPTDNLVEALSQGRNVLEHIKDEIFHSNPEDSAVMFNITQQIIKRLPSV